MYGFVSFQVWVNPTLNQETFADSNDLLSSDLLGIRQRSDSPTSHTPEPAERDFTVLDLDTGDVSKCLILSCFFR